MSKKGSAPIPGAAFGQGTIAAILAATTDPCTCKACKILRKVAESMVREFEE